MPKVDTVATIPRLMPDFAQIMADMDSTDHDPVELRELPPTFSSNAIKRSNRTQPIPDMSSFLKLWQLIGEGGTGKTLLSRYLIGELIEHNKHDQAVFAALAPGNRNLLDFAPGTLQPPTSDPSEVTAWALKCLSAMCKHRMGGVWDFGGGDTSLRMMIESDNDLATRTEEEGIAIVAAYLFSPRLDDLAFLKTYERIGFRPRATALILNLSRSENADPSSFNDIRRQPEYKAALDRGAVELWMPALPQKMALAIEKAKILFTQARDGIAPEGKREAAISVLDRSRVRIWLDAMRAELSGIEKAGWMPWT